MMSPSPALPCDSLPSQSFQAIPALHPTLLRIWPPQWPPRSSAACSGSSRGWSASTPGRPRRCARRSARRSAAARLRAAPPGMTALRLWSRARQRLWSRAPQRLRSLLLPQCRPTRALPQHRRPLPHCQRLRSPSTLDHRGPLRASPHHRCPPLLPRPHSQRLRSPGMPHRRPGLRLLQLQWRRLRWRTLPAGRPRWLQALL